MLDDITNKYTKEQLLSIILSQEKEIKKLKSVINNLEDKIEKLIEQESIDKEAANIDFITGLYNRRGLADKVSELDNTNFSVVMADIDNLKRINDQYGHIVGDKAIILVGDVLKTELKKFAGLGCRYGGDELIILLYNISPESADAICHIIQQDISYRSKKELGFEVTLSIGIAFKSKNTDPYLAKDKADKSLYYSKLLGKNCSTIYSKEIDDLLSDYMNHGAQYTKK